MEYCKGGTLSNISKKNYANEKTYEAIVKNIFLQIVKAVQYMHEEKNIIHGDLKLENILLKTNDVNFADVKITDFGLSFSDQIEKEEARPKKSSPLYNAPELQCGFRISEKTDIWAIGVILYNLLFDSFPFDINRCETLKELDQKICSKTLNFPIGNDSEKFKNAKDLITNILQKDPKQRYSINQILDHQWITKKQG
jgi:serine/threonine protein kinase